MGPFNYKDQGSPTVLGRSTAAANFPYMELTGFPAWLLWSRVHLLLLVGLRNQVLVYVQRVSARLFYVRGARLMGKGDVGLR